MKIDQRKIFFFLFFYTSLLLFFLPYFAHYLPLSKVCLFSQATGHPSPTCGATRSIISLLHLQVNQAFLFNPLAAITWLALLAICVCEFFGLSIIKVFLKKEVFRPLLAVFVFAGLLNWYLIYRNEEYLHTQSIGNIPLLF